MRVFYGPLIMPDRYRRLKSFTGEVVQEGCAAIEWPQLLKELDELDKPEWIKTNILTYKVSMMLWDAREQS